MSTSYRVLNYPSEIYIIGVPDSARSLMTISMIRAKSNLYRIYGWLEPITRMPVEVFARIMGESSLEVAAKVQNFVKKIVSIIRRGGVMFISIPLQAAVFKPKEVELQYLTIVPEDLKRAEVELVVLPALFYVPEESVIKALWYIISKTTAEDRELYLSTFVCFAKPELCGGYSAHILSRDEAKPILDAISSSGIYFIRSRHLNTILRAPELLVELKRKSVIEKMFG